MRRLVPWALLGVLTVVVFLGMAVALANQPVLASHTDVGRTRTSVSVPHGWKTYTYQHAAVSIPGDWVVRYGTSCPGGQGAGTLLIGPPKVSESCPAIPASVSYVEITTTSSRTRWTPEGVAGSPYASSIGWIVPSLGIELTGTGADVLRIYRTLHRVSTR